MDDESFSGLCAALKYSASATLCPSAQNFGKGIFIWYIFMFFTPC